MDELAPVSRNNVKNEPVGCQSIVVGFIKHIFVLFDLNFCFVLINKLK